MEQKGCCIQRHRAPCAAAPHTYEKAEEKKKKDKEKEKKRFFELKGRSLVSSFVGGGAGPSCSSVYWKNVMGSYNFRKYENGK